MGVRGGQWTLRVGCGSGSNAVGEADRTSGAVVVAGAEESCSSAQPFVDADRVEEPELSEVERGVLIAGADDSHEVIEHLGDTDRGERSGGFFEESLDVGGSGFALEQSEHRIGVEDGHRDLRVWERFESLREVRRASSMVGPIPAYFPTKDPTAFMRVVAEG